MSRSGLPLNQLIGGVHWQFLSSEWDLEGWYQQLHFESNNTGVAAAQNNLGEPIYGARLLLKGAFRVRGVPVTLGFFGERKVESQRLSPGQIDLIGVTFGGLSMGASFSQLVNRDFFWHHDVILEISPLGKVTGAALLYRMRLGWWKYRPLVPEFQLSVRPYSFTISSQSESLKGITVMASLVFGGLFRGSPNWSAPQRFPLSREPRSEVTPAEKPRNP